CQHPQTLDLLEVGEDVRGLYREQAKKASKEFLLRAMDLANDCDLQYRASKNQRLLVELTLMKLASITFDGEKKKPDFLIPAAHFSKAGPLKSGNPVLSPPRGQLDSGAVGDPPAKVAPASAPIGGEVAKGEDPQALAQPIPSPSGERPRISIPTPEK